MKILLLEDEYMLLSQITSYLVHKNHSVKGFESGDEALEAIKNEQFDLFLLDINTPNVSGLQVLQTIRTAGISSPVVMITADTDISTIDKAFRLGCSEYLKKPFALRELEIRMDRVAPKPLGLQKQKVKVSEHYEYDIKTDNLLYKGNVENLTRRQLTFIKLLVTNMGMIIDYERCKEYIWVDSVVPDVTLRSLVNRTREALREQFIMNARGVGYKIARVAQ